MDSLLHDPYFRLSDPETKRWEKGNDIIVNKNSLESAVRFVYTLTQVFKAESTTPLQTDFT